MTYTTTVVKQKGFIYICIFTLISVFGFAVEVSTRLLGQLAKKPHLHIFCINIAIY